MSHTEKGHRGIFPWEEVCYREQAILRDIQDPETVPDSHEIEWVLRMRDRIGLGDSEIPKEYKKSHEERRKNERFVDRYRKKLGEHRAKYLELHDLLIDQNLSYPRLDQIPKSLPRTQRDLEKIERVVLTRPASPIPALRKDMEYRLWWLGTELQMAEGYYSQKLRKLPYLEEAEG